jgi:DNA repair protein RadA/Sms
MSGHDVYLNVAGGLKVGEPAADLAAAAALISSFQGRPLPRDTVFFGEISLSGDVRPAPQAELRLKEAAKLGFASAIVPAGMRAENAGLALTEVKDVAELLALLSGPREVGARQISGRGRMES